MNTIIWLHSANELLLTRATKCQSKSESTEHCGSKKKNEHENKNDETTIKMSLV